MSKKHKKLTRQDKILLTRLRAEVPCPGARVLVAGEDPECRYARLHGVVVACEDCLAGGRGEIDPRTGRSFRDRVYSGDVQGYSVTSIILDELPR